MNVPTNFPVFVPENKTPQYIMIAVSLFLIISFWTLIFYVYKNTPGANASTIFYEICSPGKCAINIKTGEKRCLTDPSVSVVFNQGYEVCSSPTICDNKKLPFALLSDGSVDLHGNCEPGIVCRCTNKISCPTYITTKFDMNNGTRYLSEVSAQRYTLQQNSISDRNTLGWTGISVENVNTQLCHISPTNLFRLSPNTFECSSVDQYNPTSSSIQTCINSNPCIDGVLAVVTLTKSSDNFSVTSLENSVLACVPGISCTDLTQWPVFDIAHGRAICVDV